MVGVIPVAMKAGEEAADLFKVETHELSGCCIEYCVCDVRRLIDGFESVSVDPYAKFLVALNEMSGPDRQCSH